MNSQFKAANIFSDVKLESFPRHLFNKSYTNSFTCNHGYMYPAFCKKVIPGDRFNLKSYGRVQLTPLATNSMQNIKCYMRYFYVPHRVVWDKFDKFISQDGFERSPMLAPYTTINGGVLNALMRNGESLKLLDFLGIQFDNRIGFSIEDVVRYSEQSQISFTLFKHFSYWLIWDTFFRDENQQNEVFNIDEVTPGYQSVDIDKLNEFLPVAKEKDYFTTALPWTQKGEPVNLSSYLIGNAPITFVNNPINSPVAYPVEFRSVGWPYELAERTVKSGNDIVGSLVNGLANPVTIGTPAGAGPVSMFPTEGNVPTDVPDGIVTATVDTSQLGTTISINELRYANALQRYLERLALGGNRPAEFYLSMYGVQVDDLRIGNPLYLGGDSTYVHTTSIAQTVETESTPLATLAGNGQAQCSFSINEPYTAKEFGYVFGIFYIRPELHYTQGIARDMKEFSHMDFYNPIFAHLGEEAVMKSELMLKSDIVINPGIPERENDDIFGYQSRYAYLKQSVNEVHGELKSSLSRWLLSSRFEEVPTLNSSFITQPQNYDIFAIVGPDVADHYIVELRHDFEVESSMPDFAIPSL